MLLGHDLLVVVVANFEKGFVFPGFEYGVDVGLTAGEGDVVYFAARCGSDVIAGNEGVVAVVDGVGGDGGVEAAFGFEEGGYLCGSALSGVGVVDDGRFALVAPETRPGTGVGGVGGAVETHFETHEEEAFVGELVVVLLHVGERLGYLGRGVGAVGHAQVDLVAI